MDNDHFLGNSGQIQRFRRSRVAAACHDHRLTSVKTTVAVGAVGNTFADGFGRTENFENNAGPFGPGPGVTEPLPGGGLLVRLKALEGDRVLLEIDMTVASLEESLTIRKNWQSQSTKLYDTIYDTLTGKEE